MCFHALNCSACLLTFAALCSDRLAPGFLSLSMPLDVASTPSAQPSTSPAAGQGKSNRNNALMAQMVKAAGQRQHWKEAIVMFDEMQEEVIAVVVGPSPLSPLSAFSRVFGQSRRVSFPQALRLTNA